MIDSDKTKGSAIADSNSVRGMTDLHSCVLSEIQISLRRENVFYEKNEKEIRERTGNGSEKGKFPFKLVKVCFSLLRRKRNSELPRGFRGANVTPC